MHINIICNNSNRDVIKKKTLTLQAQNSMYIYYVYLTCRRLIIFVQAIFIERYDDNDRGHNKWNNYDSQQWLIAFFFFIKDVDYSTKRSEV